MLQKQKQEKFFQTSFVQKTNLVFGSICLFALTCMLVAFLRNLYLVARDHTLIWYALPHPLGWLRHFHLLPTLQYMCLDTIPEDFATRTRVV